VQGLCVLALNQSTCCHLTATTEQQAELLVILAMARQVSCKKIIFDNLDSKCQCDLFQLALLWLCGSIYV